MTLHWALVVGLALALGLAGCGGGGGGGGTPTGGSSTPGTGGGTPGDGGGGTPSDGDGGTPGDGGGGTPGDGSGGTPGDGGGGTPGDGGGGTPGDGEIPAANGSRAEIVFPWTRSAATASTVTVRGIAADQDGVASVTVNGVRALLTQLTATAFGRGAMAKSGFAEGDVEWSAEINLVSGDNEVTVAVEDGSGEITEDAATSTISYFEVPETFTLDAANGRIVGLSFTLTSIGYVRNLVQHNIVTGDQKVFGRLSGFPVSSCFRAVENHFLYLDHPDENVWELRRYDLGTLEEEPLFQISPVTLDPGPGFEPWLYTLKLECDSDHTSAYLLVNYVRDPAAGFEKSRVLEIPLDGSAADTLTETDTAAVEPWIATDIALSPETLVAQQESDGGARPLSSISLLNGVRADLTPGLGVNGLALAPALDLNRVYVGTFEGVEEVDISIPAKRNISQLEPGGSLTFAQVREVAFDSASNRILVGDSDLDAVIAVDLATGERSSLIAHNVGEGTPLIVPRAFALTADGLRAYVADDGGNAPARLFEIDLANGNRTEVGEIRTAITDFATGLALDEPGGRVFISGHDVVIAVDLESGTHETIASAAATDLESIANIHLDAEGKRLLIADAVVEGIYALDLVTRDLEIVSQDASRGTGPALDTPVSMTRVGTSNELYVAAQNSNQVTRVDLVTGDREELVHNCAPAFVELREVLYSESRHELLIRGDDLFSLDLASGQCTELPQRILPLKIGITPTGQLLAATFRSLLQVDRATGEVVIISK